MKSSDEFHSSFLLWWPQDWGVRFREKTMRCARSALAAAALLAAPPRPQAQAHTAATQSSFSISCSISTVLCFDSSQSGRNEAGREVSTWCSSPRPSPICNKHKADEAERGTDTMGQHHYSLSPIQARCNPRPTAVRGGTPGHPHLHCKPCQMRRCWSPSPMLLLEIQKEFILLSSALATAVLRVAPPRPRTQAHNAAIQFFLASSNYSTPSPQAKP